MEAFGGSGIALFENDKVSNAWVGDQDGFSEKHYVTVLKLRANIIPTHEFLGRGSKRQYISSMNMGFLSTDPVPKSLYPMDDSNG
ncbi:UNVERIFIED_CONTAM: hypothetical protein K2H54_064747 [Gekko kuhli]